MKIKFTKEQVKKMIEQRNSGASNQAIANEYGCSETTIRRAIKSYVPEKVTKLANEIKNNSVGQITKIKKTEKEENKVENVKTYEPIERVCIRCGTNFIIPPFEQKASDKKNFDLPKRCPKCREEMRKKIEITCVDCNNVFTITQGEKEFMEKKNLQLPKRCPVCLKFKKEANEKQIQKNAWKSPSLDFEEDE